VHRVFANVKRWGLGVYHDLRQKHLQAYIDEFVFRFNRRRTPAAAFERLLCFAATLSPPPTNRQLGSGAYKPEARARLWRCSRALPYAHSRVLC
jgi:hypothetical protein